MINRSLQIRSTMNSVIIPKRMKLEFSKPSDFDRISKMFKPEVKKVLDPDNHVAKRLDSVFRKAVDSGCVIFLSDENEDLRTMIIAYHAYVEKDHTPNIQHDYTELGSTLSLMPGYKSSFPIIAALALREWLNYPPAQKIVANINLKNTIAVKNLEEILGWKIIKDKGQCASLDAACWRTVLDESDQTGQTGLKGTPEGLESMVWFECNGKGLAKQASIMLDFIKQGGLVNRKTGHFIPVDFSVLEKEGLTHPRLEAIAGGITSRDALAKIVSI